MRGLKSYGASNGNSVVPGETLRATPIEDVD
jgi:hypothetical protein